jgi:hypothetical protein
VRLHILVFVCVHGNLVCPTTGDGLPRLVDSASTKGGVGRQGDENIDDGVLGKVKK